MRSLLLLLCVTAILSDTPGDCRYDDIVGNGGEWTFTIGSGSAVSTWSKDCSSFTASQTLGITLAFPNIATDSNGNSGTFTLIYNQGFELRIAGTYYFAFSKYVQNATGGYTSYCGETLNGWIYTPATEEYMCFVGQKNDGGVVRFVEQPRSLSFSLFDPAVIEKRVAAINSAKQPWKASLYAELYDGQTNDLRRAGVAASRLELPPQRLRKVASPVGSGVPDAFDWRNVNGVNFVSPVRDQQSCGSCYSFASMGMMEARIRIMTDNKLQPVLSTQLPLSCSLYSQGCNGGFPFLTAGKFAFEFGLIEEQCFPYQANDTISCNPCANPTLWKVSDYHYIGGYYGASTAHLMQQEILANGPIAVSFEVYDDFLHYSGGVYVHNATASAEAGFDPFVLTNHVVVIVGWGIDSTSQQKYWTVKNSWSNKWGEDGYFRILREAPIYGGECGIESLTVSVTPIIPDL